MSDSRLRNALTAAAILSLGILMTIGTAIMAPMIGLVGEVFDGISELMLRSLVTISFFPQLLVTLLLGSRWGMRLHRKKLVMAGLIIYVSAGCIGFMSYNLVMLVISRLLTGISVGIFSTLGPILINSEYHGKTREKVMGYNIACLNIGGMTAAMLSGYLVDVKWNLPYLMYAVGILTFVIFMVIPTKSEEKVSEAHGKAKFTNQHGRILAFAFIMSIMIGGISTGLALYVVEKGIGQSALVGTVMASASLVSFLVSMNASKMRTMLGGWLISVAVTFTAIGFLIMFIARSPYLLVIGCSMIYGAMGMWLPEIMLEASEVGNKVQQALAIILINVGYAVGMIVSPVFFMYSTKLLRIDIAGGEYAVAAFISCVVLLGHHFLSQRRIIELRR